MGDTNYISGVVKVLEKPVEEISKKGIPIVKFRVQFPQTRNDTLVRLIFWGDSGKSILDYYQPNDYAMIEGYIALLKKDITNSKFKKLDCVEITVFKIYPFLLKSKQILK